MQFDEVRNSNQMPLTTWDSFKYQWWIWKFLGFRPPRKTSPWYWSYIVYSFFVNISVTLLFPVTLSLNCLLSENLLEFCENLHITISDLICNIKFLILFRSRRSLLKVEPLLHYLDSRASESPLQRQCLVDGKNAVRRTFFTFVAVFGCALVTSELMVVFGTERSLMYPEWLPWDWQRSTRHFLYAHAYQSYALVFQATLDLANDTYLPAYMSILTAHMKALGIRIQEIGKDGFACNKEKNFQILQDCIKDQNVIYELFCIIEKPISTICLGQFICTALAQCTIGVYMIHIGVVPSKLLNIFIFFSVVTFETFILCYYGDLLCHECDKLTQAIYACQWPDQNAKFRKAILLLLQRSQKIHVIKAGNLIPMRLPSFVKVMKASYSIFTLLNKFK